MPLWLGDDTEQLDGQTGRVLLSVLTPYEHPIGRGSTTWPMPPPTSAEWVSRPGVGASVLVDDDDVSMDEPLGGRRRRDCIWLYWPSNADHLPERPWLQPKRLFGGWGGFLWHCFERLRLAAGSRLELGLGDAEIAPPPSGNPVEEG